MRGFGRGFMIRIVRTESQILRIILKYLKAEILNHSIVKTFSIFIILTSLYFPHGLDQFNPFLLHLRKPVR